MDFELTDDQVSLQEAIRAFCEFPDQYQLLRSDPSLRKDPEVIRIAIACLFALAILFTSGTTGEPRGALHVQRYLPGQRLQAAHWLGSEDGELAWCTAASGWAKSARNAFVAPWLTGAAALLHDGRFDPEERLHLIEREGVNVLCQAPTEYRMIAKRATLRRLPSVRRMVSAGEAINPEVIAEFRERAGTEICDGYGQTETGALTAVQPGDEPKPGSMGRPLPGIDLRISDGELQLRASTSAWTSARSSVQRSTGPSRPNSSW
jgi:acyl-coenzyme A synthetase/AMP-(fatty) acid ligase